MTRLSLLVVLVFAAAAPLSEAATKRQHTRLRQAILLHGDGASAFDKNDGKNIPGPKFDGGACALAEGKDVRKDAQKVDVCKQECKKDPECMAIVFHPWGVMKKKNKGSEKAKENMEGRVGFVTYTKKPVDCILGNWTKMDESGAPLKCEGSKKDEDDKPCGGGTMKMTRKILKKASGGGKACPNDASKVKEVSCDMEYCKKGSFNIEGNEDTKLGACSVQKDIRGNKKAMKTCFDECTAKELCKGIVFHKWGTMFKTAVPTKAGKTNDNYLAFEKPSLKKVEPDVDKAGAENSGGGCCKTCSKSTACGDGCISNGQKCTKPKGCACQG